MQGPTCLGNESVADATVGGAIHLLLGLRYNRRRKAFDAEAGRARLAVIYKSLQESDPVWDEVRTLFRKQLKVIRADDPRQAGDLETSRGCRSFWPCTRPCCTVRSSRSIRSTATASSLRSE
ncbi:hypothetical protein DEO23_12155 [Brachybacterium endophyticum]|uniref:Uncharacterized protein n=1 Tax=Brachybacterium endophyticum TaxID=2182385 RepID=A0A2U2RHN5_9MICO|nr:hypothetical protein DEO23_12155 [Brachybacterium endophyticum]